jgi:hypothetical protein
LLVSSGVEDFEEQAITIIRGAENITDLFIKGASKAG